MTNLTRMGFEGFSADYPRGTRIDPHRHRSHQILHAAAGVMRITSQDGTWVVPPGRALWMPAGMTHGIVCIGAVAMRTVYIDGSHAAFPQACAVWRISPLLRELILRMAAGVDMETARHLQALIVAEIEAIEAMPLHIPEPTDRRLRRTTAMLLATPGLDLPLEILAREAGMSPRTLIRRFQADTGMTLRQWRRQARLLLGLERLAAGANVSEAAYDVGYSSASAFIHAFRTTFGTTPGQYFR
jgi:AraC-like DNA-binding protein